MFRHNRDKISYKRTFEIWQSQFSSAVHINMKVLCVVLASILVASAVPYGTNKVVFNQDGSFTIFNGIDHQITFPVPTGVHSQNFVEVFVNSVQIPGKTITLDVHHPEYPSAYHQIYLLHKFFLPYDGQVITPQVFEDILYQIKNAVVQHEISPVVYAAVQAIHHQHLFDQLVIGEGVFAREGQVLGTPVTGVVANKVFEHQFYGPYEHHYGQQYQHGYGQQYQHVYGQQYQHGYGQQYQHGYPYNTGYGVWNYLKYGQHYPYGLYQQVYGHQYPTTTYGHQYPTTTYGFNYPTHYSGVYHHGYGYTHHYPYNTLEQVVY